MIVFFELPLTSLTRRFAPTRVMAVGYALVGLGMGLNIFGANLWVLTISMVIFTIGEMISLPIGHSYMANLAPEEMRGRYMGVLSVAWSSATMVGPAAGVALYQFSPPVLWVVVFSRRLFDPQEKSAGRWRAKHPALRRVVHMCPMWGARGCRTGA